MYLEFLFCITTDTTVVGHEDALGCIMVCNGDTLLEQWMLVVLFWRRYFYHLKFL
jgi:hypothetical protein